MKKGYILWNFSQKMTTISNFYLKTSVKLQNYSIIWGPPPATEPKSLYATGVNHSGVSVKSGLRLLLISVYRFLMTRFILVLTSITYSFILYRGVDFHSIFALHFQLLFSFFHFLLSQHLNNSDNKRLGGHFAFAILLSRRVSIKTETRRSVEHSTRQ